MAAYQVLLLNTAVPQIQAAQSGDTYVVPRDIAFSAALTLSAGTANGVPYLNGNQVVTTGSALTFDGSRFSVIGSGTLEVAQFGTSTDNTPSIGIYSNGSVRAKLRASSAETALLTQGNLPLLFGVNDIERARITSGGDFLVGTTGLPINNGKLSVSGNSRFYQSASDGAAAITVDKSSTTDTTSQVFVQFTINNQNTGSGQINANGASQAAFGSFSDGRLKQNIVDLPSQWINIKSLRPVEFDYIQSEGGGHQLGFIAQEVQQVYPDLVGQRADEMLTLSGMGKGEARLIKALQEAMARIETLEAKIVALEAK